jgi:hypothetical protein
MTTLSHGSATIYQFPARGRFAATSQGQESNATSAPGSALPRGAKLAVGGAWYHDEAIRSEDERAS